MNDEIYAILNESVLLLIIGMAVVFSFLTLLVLTTQLIYKVCLKFPGTEPAQQGAIPNKHVPPSVVAAITAAIHQHRQSR